MTRTEKAAAGGIINGILDTETDSAPDLMKNIVHHVADALKINNPKFNKDRFMAYVYSGVKYGGPGPIKSSRRK